MTDPLKQTTPATAPREAQSTSGASAAGADARIDTGPKSEVYKYVAGQKDGKGNTLYTSSEVEQLLKSADGVTSAKGAMFAQNSRDLEESKKLTEMLYAILRSHSEAMTAIATNVGRG